MNILAIDCAKLATSISELKNQAIKAITTLADEVFGTPDISKWSKLPKRRYTQTHELKLSTLGESWKKGDLTLRGAADGKIQVWQHVVVEERVRGAGGIIWTVKPMHYLKPATLSFSKDELAKLHANWKSWRLDDLLDCIALDGNKITFMHRPSRTVYTATLELVETNRIYHGV